MNEFKKQEIIIGTIISVLVVVLFVLIIILLSNPTHASITCGIKPIVPIGCDDMICIDGQWRCINYNK